MEVALFINELRMPEAERGTVRRVDKRQSKLSDKVGVSIGNATYDGGNVRSLVQEALQLAGDPLDLIHSDQTVCLKPNWIAGSREGHPDEWEQIITHPQVLEAVLVEVGDRLGSGRIVIADAPQTDSDFKLISQRLGLAEMLVRATKRWPKLTIQIIDLRQEYWIQRGTVTVQRRRLAGDPRGSVRIDLKEASEFDKHDNNGQYYGADYDFADTRNHHTQGRHEYLISRSVMESDVFINIPKLKTHKKAGITVSLKNLVGINSDKNYLPHHSIGPPSRGGDEFPDEGLKRGVESILSRYFKKVVALSGGRAPVWGPFVRGLGSRVFGPTSEVIRSGNWWGNETLWRMCLDLNRILLHFDAEGNPRSDRRPYVSIVDGIVAGEGDGPVGADAKPIGVVIAGWDGLAVDLVASRLMGFDWRKIPILSHGLGHRKPRISEVSPETVLIQTSNEVGGLQGLGRIEPLAYFKPHFGWAGHIELEATSYNA